MINNKFKYDFFFYFKKKNLKFLLFLNNKLDKYKKYRL